MATNTRGSRDHVHASAHPHPVNEVVVTLPTTGVLYQQFEPRMPPNEYTDTVVQNSVMSLISEASANLKRPREGDSRSAADAGSDPVLLSVPALEAALTKVVRHIAAGVSSTHAADKQAKLAQACGLLVRIVDSQLREATSALVLDYIAKLAADADPIVRHVGVRAHAIRVANLLAERADELYPLDRGEDGNAAAGTCVRACILRCGVLNELPLDDSFEWARLVKRVLPFVAALRYCHSEDEGMHAKHSATAAASVVRSGEEGHDAPPAMARPSTAMATRNSHWPRLQVVLLELLAVLLTAQLPARSWARPGAETIVARVLEHRRVFADCAACATPLPIGISVAAMAITTAPTSTGSSDTGLLTERRALDALAARLRTRAVGISSRAEAPRAVAPSYSHSIAS